MSALSDWTNQDLDQLRMLWDEGVPTAEIARRMGRSKNSVVGKAHRLQLTARESPIIRTGPRKQSEPRPAAPRRTLEIEPSGPAEESPKHWRGGAAAVERARARAAQPSVAPPAPPPAPVAPSVSSAVRLSGRACRYCLPSGEDFPRWRYCDAAIPDDGRRMPYCDEHYRRCIAPPRNKEAASAA
jgi:GcrA cell cycle regulator